MGVKYTIVIISDTHTNHKGIEKKLGLPPADFIIHCGDISGRGDEYSIRQFLDWFSDLHQYNHKIFIAGNHDRLFEDQPTLAKEIVAEHVDNDVYYLEDSGIELWGVKFWGSPVTRPFMDWAFNRTEEKMKLHWEAIPEDTNVLITHGPPYMIMDYAESGSAEHTGSESLYWTVFDRVRPQVHCFGHIHEQYGLKEIDGIKIVNASTLNAQYKLVNPPVVVEIEI